MTEDLDWVSLDKSEEVLWQGEPRIHSIIPALVIGVPLTLVFGIGILIMVGAYLNIKNTDFLVTSQGIYRKQGVMSRSVQKIGFDKIQNISFSQTALGNYFGYGNVEVSTAGGSGVEMKFNAIEDPKKVQELINEHIRDDRSEERTSSMEKVLEELQEIRKSVENIERNIS